MYYKISEIDYNSMLIIQIIAVNKMLGSFTDNLKFSHSSIKAFVIMVKTFSICSINMIALYLIHRYQNIHYKEFNHSFRHR